MSTSDWWPVVGAVLLGQVVLILTELGRGIVERRERRRDQRRAFQTETLIELQDVALAVVMDKLENPFPGAMNEANREAFSDRWSKAFYRYRALYSRVDDDHLRRLGTNLTGYLIKTLESPQAWAENQAIIPGAYELLADRIGDLIRRPDPPSPVAQVLLKIRSSASHLGNYLRTRARRTWSSLAGRRASSIVGAMSNSHPLQPKRPAVGLTRVLRRTLTVD